VWESVLQQEHRTIIFCVCLFFFYIHSVFSDAWTDILETLPYDVILVATEPLLCWFSEVPLNWIWGKLPKFSWWTEHQAYAYAVYFRNANEHGRSKPTLSSNDNCFTLSPNLVATGRHLTETLALVWARVKQGFYTSSDCCLLYVNAIAWQKWNDQSALPLDLRFALQPASRSGAICRPLYHLSPVLSIT